MSTGAASNSSSPMSIFAWRGGSPSSRATPTATSCIIPDASFDYVILSQTLQATRHPRHVLEQLLRIGRHAIVSFPNFGHWRIRLQFLIHGRMPVTPNLPEPWHETQNIHHCTIKDFLTLCEVVDAKVERTVALNAYGKRMGLNLPLVWHNLIGEQAVFLLTRQR